METQDKTYESGTVNAILSDSPTLENAAEYKTYTLPLL
jgi:hypothetical protein